MFIVVNIVQYFAYVEALKFLLQYIYTVFINTVELSNYIIHLSTERINLILIQFIMFILVNIVPYFACAEFLMFLLQYTNSLYKYCLTFTLYN